MNTSPWRAAATMATAVGLSLALSSCSGAPSPSPTPGGAGGSAAQPFAGQAISVWFPGANQVEIDLVTKTIVPAFEAKTGAKAEVTFVDWGDLSPKLNAGFAAGTAPDVFGHGPAAVADFVVNDRVEDLGPYVAKLPQADTTALATALPGGQVGGVQYLIPLSLQGNLVMYNAADFTAAGLDPDKPPTTWQALRAAAEKLTTRDGGKVSKAGLLVPTQAIGNQQTFTTLLFGNGGTLLSADGKKAAFNSTQGVAALQFMVDLFSGDSPVATMLGEDYANLPAAKQPLTAGTAAATMLGAPMMSQIVAGAPDKDLRVLPPLTFEGANSPAAFGGVSAGLMINSDSKNKDLAWEFISYFVSADVAGRYTQGIGAIPARSDAIDTPYVKANPVLQAFVKAAPQLRPNPNVPGWVQARDVLVKYLDEAMFGKSDPKTALDAAAAQVDQILAANA